MIIQYKCKKSYIFFCLQKNIANNGKDPDTVDRTVSGPSTKRERLENEKRNDVFAYMIQDKSKVVRGKMLIKYEVNKKSDL